MSGEPVFVGEVSIKVYAHDSRGTYWSSSPTGQMKGNVATLREWEGFHLYNAAGGKIALKSFGDRWLCSYADGVYANRGDLGPWEKFQFIVHRQISERSYEVSFLTKHHTYVCVDSDGLLLVDRTAIGTWEKFELSLIQKYSEDALKPTPSVRKEANVADFQAFMNSFLSAGASAAEKEKSASGSTLPMIKSPIEGSDYRGKVSLRLISSGTYVTALPQEQQYAVKGDSTWLRETEGFELHSTAPGIAAFKTANGTWICAEPNGKVVNDRKSVVNWEQFIVFVNGKLSDRSFDVSLRTYHGKFIRQSGSGLVADAAEITNEARFELKLIDKYNDGPSQIPVMGRVSPMVFWEFLFPLLGSEKK